MSLGERRCVGVGGGSLVTPTCWATRRATATPGMIGRQPVPKPSRETMTAQVYVDRTHCPPPSWRLITRKTMTGASGAFSCIPKAP